MDFLGIGDNIGYSKYNALVYLLRKFKRLTSNLQLGDNTISSDYGTYNIMGGLTSIEGNWILEDNVDIIGTDCLPNCEYTFSFTVIDVNTTCTVNKREISFTGFTGETGELNITIPVDSIESDEQILSSFKVDIVFDLHEYYTRPVGVNVDLTIDKQYILDGESATVTAILTDDTGTPMTSTTAKFNVNGVITTKTTDNTGKATLTVNGDGTTGLINISVLNKSVQLIDAYFLDKNNNDCWWNQGGDWNTSIFREFKRLLLTCQYERFYLASTIPSISNTPPTSDLLSIPTPFCVEFETNTMGYPNNMPTFCLMNTNGYFEFTLELFMFIKYKILIYEDKLLVWRNNTLTEYTFSSATTDLMFGFHIGGGHFNANMEYKDLIVYNLEEPVPHNYALSVTGTSIIQTGDSANITASLTDNGSACIGETLSYQVKHDNAVISSGTSTTDNNGEASIPYTGTGIGDVDVIVSFGMSLQETYEIEDCIKYIADATSCSSCDIDLPSRAIISFKMSKPIITGTNGGVNMQLIDNSNHTYFVGNWSSLGDNGLLIRNTGSSSNLVDQRCSSISANTEYLLGITYDNGDWTYFKDSEVKSFTANYTPTKINVIQIQQGYMKEFKIKAL